MYTGRVRIGLNANYIICNTIDRQTINRGGRYYILHNIRYEHYSKENVVNRLCIGTPDFVHIGYNDYRLQ